MDEYVCGRHQDVFDARDVVDCRLVYVACFHISSSHVGTTCVLYDSPTAAIKTSKAEKGRCPPQTHTNFKLKCPRSRNFKPKERANLPRRPSIPLILRSGGESRVSAVPNRRATRPSRMHRTRHSSLDDVGTKNASSQEEWSEFLSRSMRALSTAESTASSPPPPSLDTTSPTRRRRPHESSDCRRGGKSRGMSMNEITSPLLDVWRPLGRRVASSSPPPTLTRSSSSSLESTTSSREKLTEPHAAQPSVGRATFGQLATTLSCVEPMDGKLPTTSHFRAGSSCRSSSSSSSYASSSVDEERQEGAMEKSGGVGVMGQPPPPLMDSSYADSCLPVLSQLPRPSSSMSVDSGSGSRPSALVHVKSPVLGNRKDAQTWQLQDEEFFMTSPRFGASLGNRDRGSVDLFRENTGGLLLSAYVGASSGLLSKLDLAW